MVRMVMKDGALGARWGGNCSSIMDGSKTIHVMRLYPGRGSVYYSGGFRYQVGRLSKRERRKKSKIGRVGRGGGSFQGG